MQIPVKIPPKAREGSVRFWRVPVQMVRFRCRYLVRFRRVLVQMLCKIPKSSDVFFGIST